MTNALITLTNNIAKADQNHVAAPILKMCTAITPQFYKNKSVEELQAEALSIELLTQNIPPEVLGDMCQLAILNYPSARSRSDKTFFDINYILTFFTQAFNERYCNNVNLDGCEYVGYSIDEKIWLLTEVWKTKDGKEVLVKEVLSEEHKQRYLQKGYERCYSSAYYKQLNRNWLKDLENIEL